MTEKELDDIIKEKIPKSLLIEEQFDVAKSLQRHSAIKYIKETANLSLKEAAIYFDFYIKD